MLLHEARGRTLLLISPLSDDDLCPQHKALISPIVRDLGHIGHFEEVWFPQISGTSGRAQGRQVRTSRGRSLGCRCRPARSRHRPRASSVPTEALHRHNLPPYVNGD